MAMNDTVLRFNKYLMLWGTMLLSFVACYYPTLLWLNEKFSAPESNYSHGYIIPLITAYMIYEERGVLTTISISSNLLGLYLVIAALLVHIFGTIGNIHFISGFSMILYLAGCSLFLFGSEFTKTITYPLLYLIFMCPVPDAFIDICALPMKSFSTSLAMHLMDILGFPYLREGFRIILPNATFVVETTCNGMRSLISFLALGFLILNFINGRLWKKLLFLAINLPLAISLNAVRITILLLITIFYGQKMAAPESILHDGSGLLVFIIGFIFLVVLSRKINEERAI